MAKHQTTAQTPSKRTTATRDAICSAAIALAAERGITRTTMDDIAERANVAKGSLYYNFNSKSAIFEHILVVGLTHLSARIDAAREAQTNPSLALEAMVDEVLQTIHSQPNLAQVVLSEIFRVDREWRASVGVARDTIISSFAKAAHSYATLSGTTLEYPEFLGAGIVGAALVAGIDWHLYHSEVPVRAVTKTILIGLRIPISETFEAAD